MLDMDPGLPRRLQLRQGLVWLAAAQGDPYAALLRGLDTDPRDHWQALTRRPLFRSATGDWVTATHSVAEEVRRASALRACPLLDAGDGADDVPWRDADTALHAERSWDRVLDRHAGEVDLVAVAHEAAVGTLARAWALDALAERRLRSAVDRSRGALDAPFYPQNPAGTRRIAQGLIDVRDAVPARAPAGLLVAAAGIPMATDLLVNAVAAGTGPDDAEAATRWKSLAARPERAERVVRETLRLAPPVQLHAAVARIACTVAGQRIEAGERVVTVLGAANRDPRVFADPDRFDPDRPAGELAGVLLPGSGRHSALAFAVTVARQGLLRLAARRPSPVPGHVPFRRAAAPVSRSLVAYRVTVA
ncbi:Cytochrome P450 family protein EryCII [Streptomyces sp. enrichment culture]